ncbi:MAG: hypothetical protein R3190_06245 [Thermoanaerobaculia bacterium]|nr:hypothetical protein [Thermoanaerobaculia bacterium]
MRQVALGALLGLLALPPAGLGQGAAGTTTTSRNVSAPPYYRGKLPPRPSAVTHLPVSVGAPHDGLPAQWIPVVGLERLAADITAWLEESGRSTGRGGIGASARMSPPRVYLGCALDLVGECSVDERTNVLATTSATKAWREQFVAATGGARDGWTLLLQLDLAPLWIHQRNLRGAKEVRLGTDYVQSLPWLTSLDTPVYVLQLNGAVLDGEGKVMRAGAEGLWALRTPFRASIAGAQKLMDDADVERVRTELRRADLAGSPLVWQAAAAELLAQLLGPD